MGDVIQFLFESRMDAGFPERNGGGVVRIVRFWFPNVSIAGIRGIIPFDRGASPCAAKIGCFGLGPEGRDPRLEEAMRDEEKNRDQLLAENRDLRQRLAELQSKVARLEDMEKAAAHQDALLAVMLRDLPFDFWVRDLDGRVVMQSAVSVRVWGDLVHDPLGAQTLPAHVLKAWETANARAYAGEIVKTERAYALPSGELRIGYDIIAPIRGREGVLGILGANIDITERERAVTALRRSENNLASLLNAIEESAALFDRDARIITANHTFAARVGRSVKQCVGMNVFDFVPPEVGRERFRHFKEVLRTGEARTFEDERQGRWMRHSLTPVLDSQGMVTALAVFVTDFTKYKRAQDELHKSETLLNLTQRLSRVGGWEFDARRQVLSWTQELYLLHGFDPKERLGAMELRERSLACYDPDDRERVYDAFRRCLEEGQPYDLEAPFTSVTGKRMRVRTMGQAVLEDGHVVRVFGTFMDITERVRNEDALRAAKEDAEAANRAKSEFLANMSHEIRTPLNGVLGILQLMEDLGSTPEQKEYIGLAISSAMRLTRLLSDILDLSRIESGRLALDERPFDPRELRDSTLGIFSLAAREKGIELGVAIADNVPPFVLGDDSRVRQVLFNLVGNAIKFTEHGFVRADITALPHGKTPMVLLCVADSGIGISDERLPSIFEPFVQGEGSYVRKHQGAGLGLAIVRRLVGLMRGNLSVDNGSDGTTVCISLPLPPAVGEKNAPPERDDDVPTGLRILLVEDDRVSLFAARRMLEKIGHAVTTAENGRRALDALRDGDFDLVFMDVQMPIMDGVEATRLIRDDPTLGRKRDVPIVAMTAYAMAGDREKFLSAGMTDYVAKPLGARDVCQVLARIGARPGGRTEAENREGAAH